MRDPDDFLAWVDTRLHDAEFAVHNGDAAPRRAIWARNDPVTVHGVLPRDHRGRRRRRHGYTVGLEHTQASINGEPRTYSLRATQVYRREDGEWKVAHRHADPVAAPDEA